MSAAKPKGVQRAKSWDDSVEEGKFDLPIDLCLFARPVEIRSDLFIMKFFLRSIPLPDRRL